MRKNSNSFTWMWAAIVVMVSSLSAETKAAETQWIRYEDYKVLLNAPEGWRVERDLYGMPITVLGPERNGERAILNLQHTTIENLDFDHAMLKKTQKEYFDGRREWLSTLEGARLLSTIPYRELSWKNGNEGYEIGVKYRLRGLDFEEKSIEVTCGNRLYFLKTLTSNKQTTEDAEVLKKMIQQLECTAVTAADGPEEPSPLRKLDEKVAAKASEAWPTAEEIKKAPLEAKANILESLVAFQKDFEEAYGEEMYSAYPSGKNELYAKFQSAFSSLISNAVADGGYDCFYAGWPSKFVKKGNSVTCGSPAETNPSYSSLVGSACGDGQLSCNPAVFGDGICISIASRSERARATLRCEAKFKDSGKSYEQVAKSEKFDQAHLLATIQAAQNVCSNERYINENFGLCSTLKDKLNLSIQGGQVSPDQGAEQFLNGIDHIKPENYDQTLDLLMKEYPGFEKRCFNEKNELKTEEPGCVQEMADWANDFEKFEKLHASVGEELDEVETSSSGTLNKKEDCPTCGANPALVQDEVSAHPNANSCSVDDLKAIKDGECKWSSVGWWGKTGLGCGWNIVTSIVKSLWSAIKGIGELAWMGVKYVGNKVTQAFGWFKRKLGFENASAEKAHQAAQTSDSLIDEFKRAPIETAWNLAKSIFQAVKDYARNDVFCQKWSGVPHFSTCQAPANFSCLSCTAIVSGTCSLAGYVIGEFVPALLTGGASVALKSGAVGGRIAGMLSKAGQAGKLSSLTVKMASKFPKTSTLLLGANKTSQAWKLAGKAGKVPRWTGSAKKLYAVKNSFKRAAIKFKNFRSAKYGNFKSTAARLNMNRAKYFVLKNGYWVLKTPIKIATAPVRYPYKWSKSLAKGLYVNRAKGAYNLGIRWGEKIAHSKNAAYVVGDKFPAFTRRLAYTATVAKYPPRMQNLVNKVEKRIEVDWTTDEEIEIQAKAEGKKPEEIREILKAERRERLINEGLADRLIHGKDTEADVKLIMETRKVDADEARRMIFLEKFDMAALGEKPKFTPAELELWAKDNGTKIEYVQKDLQAAIAEHRKNLTTGSYDQAP